MPSGLGPIDRTDVDLVGRMESEIKNVGKSLGRSFAEEDAVAMRPKNSGPVGRS